MGDKTAGPGVGWGGPGEWEALASSNSTFLSPEVFEFFPLSYAKVFLAFPFHFAQSSVQNISQSSKLLKQLSVPSKRMPSTQQLHPDGKVSRPPHLLGPRTHKSILPNTPKGCACPCWQILSALSSRNSSYPGSAFRSQSTLRLDAGYPPSKP